MPPALKSVQNAGPNGYLRGFIDSYPQRAGTSVFLSRPTVQPPSPTSLSFRPIATADLTQWLGDLAAALVSTINPWANNEVVHQSCPGVSGSRWLYGHGAGQVGKVSDLTIHPWSQNQATQCSGLPSSQVWRAYQLRVSILQVQVLAESDVCHPIWSLFI